MSCADASRAVRWWISLFSLFTVGAFSTSAQDRAADLQRQGLDRIDAFQKHFLRTWDQTALLPELDRAAQELSTSAELYSQRRDGGQAALSLVRLGDIHRMRGNIPEALRLCREAIQLARNANAPESLAVALIGEGRIVLETQKDFAAAALILNEAARISGPLPNRKPHFDALCYAGQMQLALGDMIAAFDSLNRAISLGPELKEPTPLMYAYFERGDVYLKLSEKCVGTKAYNVALENLRLAEADYAAAIAVARKLGFNAMAQQIQSSGTRLVVQRQMVQKNINLQGALAKANIFNPRVPGDVVISEHFTPGSSDFPPGFVEIVRASGILSMGDARSLFTTGHFHATAGEDDLALKAYLRSTEMLEKDRRQLQDEKTRGDFFADRITYYYPPVLHLLSRKRFAEAFELLERSRSRSMADLLSSRRMAFATAEEQSLFGEIQRRRAEIALAQKNLFALRAKPTADSAAALGAAEQVLAKLEAADEVAASQLKTKAPRLKTLLVAESVPLAQFEASLQRDQVDVLYYLVLEEHVVIWHLGRESHVRSIILPREELVRKVNALRRSLTDPKSAFDTKSARELYLFLVQPVIAWLTGKSVIIIPHEELHAVPFQAFINPAGKSFGETHAISYAPSATVLASLRRTESLAKARVFAAADPEIEEARTEVQALGAMFPGARILADALPKKSEVQSSVAGRDIVHLSVHGRYQTQEPMLSYLQLAKADGDDGRLTAAEMFGLPLDSARLVVLSACETGQSEATRSNELIGMQRALLFAGAQNLVLSGWRVDAAATRLWMTNFYREAQVQPLAEAARRSLVVVKQKFPHPYFWAPFTLVGK